MDPEDIVFTLFTILEVLLSIKLATSLVLLALLLQLHYIRNNDVCLA